MIKVLKSDERSFQILKRLIFPNPFTPLPQLLPLNKDKEKMHPHDCPENSLRHALIQLMTSLDTNLKRCVSECLFLLCHQNSKTLPTFSLTLSLSLITWTGLEDEFVYRTGFGNAIALLQLKGLF